MQFGVDAANRAAQQYQQSKDQQKLLQQSRHRCDQENKAAQYFGLLRMVVECSLSTLQLLRTLERVDCPNDFQCLLSSSYNVAGDNSI